MEIRDTPVPASISPPNPDGTASVVRQGELVAQLSLIVLGAQPLDEVLAAVARLTHEAVPTARDVSVTLLEDRYGDRERGRPKARTVAFRGALAVELDERQYESGFGPCLDAAASGSTILLDVAIDLATDRTYPHFSSAARHAGVPQVLAVGLPLPNRTVGALNLYAAPTGVFTPDDIDAVAHFAAFAAVAVANATLYEDATALTADMVAAMASRATIEQAKGMLMERHGCTADEAFTMLRGASSRGNIKLREVAAGVTGTLAALGEVSSQ